MSIWTQIQCDWCESVWDEDDGENFTENLDVCRDWYAHICESCMDSIQSCGWCGYYHECENDIRYCEFLDDSVCDDCIDEAHEDQDEFTGECEDCGFEGEPHEPAQGPWAGVIG